MHVVEKLKQIQQEVQQEFEKLNEKLLERTAEAAKQKQLLNKKNKFYFLDGPPYANDVPHVGHIKNFIIKDIVIRKKMLEGYYVFFKPGFDTHGLPIEHAMEKKLGLKNKKDIIKYGVANFLKLCKNNATLNMELWMDVYKQLGSVYCLKKPYLTYENYYLESAWWTFKRWFNQGLIYESEKPIHYCPRCQTSLAGYEVTDSYAMLEDPSIFVLFKIKDKDEYLLVWTTTPWTLISNTALILRDDADYVKVKLSDGRQVWLAESRLDVLSEIGYGYEIIEKTKGKNLVGLSYEPLLDVPVQLELEQLKQEKPNIHKVLASIKLLKERVASKTATKKQVKQQDIYEDFVVLDEGTGIVHCAGGHGKTDYAVSQHYGLPAISPLDDECKFNNKAGFVLGMFVKDADAIILEKLNEQNKLLHATKVKHSYPVCWRCKTPLIVKLSKEIFVNITKFRKLMLEENNKVLWLPKFAKTRFDNWLENVEDWNISRQRYWGIPIPLWKCECGEIKVIGSFAELREEAAKAGTSISDDFDLHNAHSITLKCDKCGKDMHAVKAIFDVWFDSGIAPWASLGYPYHDIIFDDIWPVDRINEGQDQIRGWFYSLMASSIATFHKAPYKCVSMVGWVLDAKGKKMSKSLGNVVYAKDAINELGADLLRFYMMYDCPPYSVQNFNPDIAKKDIAKFFNILLNLLNFVLMLKPTQKQQSNVADVWIEQKLNKLINDYNNYIEQFEMHKAMRAMYDFVILDLSRDYIKFIRDNANEKAMLLVNILKTLTILLAPVCPFVSHYCYVKLKQYAENNNINVSFEISPHLDKWPEMKQYNAEILEKMQLALSLIEKILSLRAKAKINVRWPLPAAYTTLEMPDELLQLVAKQVNVKQIKKVDKQELNSFKLKLDDTALDTQQDEQLIAEGFAREIVRHIQEARKKAKLNKQQTIKLSLQLSEKLKAMLEKYNLVDAILKKVNAIAGEATQHSFEFNVKDETIKIVFDVE